MHSLKSQQGERWVKRCLCILFSYYECSYPVEGEFPLKPYLTSVADEFPHLPEGNDPRSPAIYRFRFPMEVSMQRIPSQCRPSLA